MKVFVAGPRSVHTLNENVTDMLSLIIKNQNTVLIGDASGVDKLVQKFFAEKNYSNVFIYASEGKARNNLGGWPINNVNVPSNSKGFDFYSQKDIRMAIDADNGFMIWNGKSKGTLNNILNLVKQNKEVVIYLLPSKKRYLFNDSESVKHFVEHLAPDAYNLLNELNNSSNASISTDTNKSEQLTISDLY